MIKFREEGEVSVKEAYEEIGWSIFDCSTIYRRTSTKYTIADGLISEEIDIVNKDGSQYKARVYRNYCNYFVEV